LYIYLYDLYFIAFRGRLILYKYTGCVGQGCDVQQQIIKQINNLTYIGSSLIVLREKNKSSSTTTWWKWHSRTQNWTFLI